MSRVSFVDKDGYQWNFYYGTSSEGISVSVSYKGVFSHVARYRTFKGFDSPREQALYTAQCYKDAMGEVVMDTEECIKGSDA